MQWLGSILYTGFFLVTTLLWSIAVACSVGASPDTRFAMARGWARLQLGALKLLCKLDYVVEGSHNIPAQTAVVMQKHSSAWETIAGIVYYPTHTWVLKRELMWIPILGWALAMLRVVPINRKGRRKAVHQVVAHGTERLRDGYNVMIYPEGTRVAVGENGRFGRSGSLLAATSGHPVVPIAHNAGEYWGRRAWLKRAGTVRVCIGPPIATNGKTAEQVNTEVQTWIEQTMLRISPAHAARRNARDHQRASVG